MIYEIKNSDYYKVKNLLRGIRNFPEVRSIIDNTNPGNIYVDDIDSPMTALVWSQGIQGFYFIGNEDNNKFLRNINEYIDKIILPKLIDKGINWFEISGVTENWNQIIEDVFKDRNVQYEYQLVYLLKNKNFTYDKDLIESYDIKKVEKDTFEKMGDNLDFVKNELELFWGTIDNFLDNGICYYAMEDNKIVSMCYSGFKADKTQTIGIETLKENRKKGFAYGLASKFIENCFKNDIEPYWDCSEDNTGSKILADKLGFIIDNKYRCYWFNF